MCGFLEFCNVFFKNLPFKNRIKYVIMIHSMIIEELGKNLKKLSLFVCENVLTDENKIWSKKRIRRG